MSNDDKFSDFNLRAGFIYIVQNKAHKENLYKVGYTTESVNERLAREKIELSGTFSPADLTVLKQFPVVNPMQLEKEIHKTLKPYLYKGDNRRKEWFEIEYEELVKTIIKSVNTFQIKKKRYQPIKINLDLNHALVFSSEGIAQKDDKFKITNIKAIVDRVKEYKPIVFGKEHECVSIDANWNKKPLSQLEKNIENLVNALYSAGYSALVVINFPIRQPYIHHFFVKPKKYSKLTIQELRKKFEISIKYCKKCSEMTYHYKSRKMSIMFRGEKCINCYDKIPPVCK